MVELVESILIISSIVLGGLYFIIQLILKETHANFRDALSNIKTEASANHAILNNMHVDLKEDVKEIKRELKDVKKTPTPTTSTDSN